MITLSDAEQTKATAFPINDVSEICDELLEVIRKTFNKELDLGRTYPYLDPMSVEEFKKYWFSHFVQILLKGVHTSEVLRDSSQDWDNLFLGTNYIKPNYTGRCSHNCNAGFLVSFKYRGSPFKLGKNMGKVYLQWAPKLGYTYSVFNLVFVSNVASVKIWDSLGFDRIGRVPNAGRLKGDDKPTDAIIFGKSLIE